MINFPENYKFSKKQLAYVGKQFGKLKVLELAGLYAINIKHKKTKERKIGYRLVLKVQCECKTIKFVSIKSLDTIKSCGKGKCIPPPHKKLDYGVAAFNSLYKYYKICAINRNLEFSLTKEEFKNLIIKNCHYCNNPPSNKKQTKTMNGPCIYNGIDREDNTKGYILSNSVPCCARCNRMKYKYSLEDFISHITRIYNFYVQGNQ